jgi:hypothetical protein
LISRVPIWALAWILVFLESLQLNGPSGIDALANQVRSFTGVFAGEFLVTRQWDAG